MQAPIEVQKQLVRERIARSINVSGAFDNCFFHCYAAHLLANELPLPEDLFSFESISGAQSPASQLQKLFPSSQALDIFAKFDRYKYPDAVSDKNYVVEKTLVLGFLMREWFATKLASDNNHMNDMLLGENGIVTTFNGYRTFRQFSEKEAIISGPEGTKFIPNEAFLEYFSARTNALSEEELSRLPLEIRRFEQYFIDAENDDEVAIATYWQAEGYQNYCKYLAQPGVKLTPSDTLPVLASLEQSLTVYNSDGSIQTSFDGSDEDSPRLEISLEVLAGHYHLFTTEETNDYLREYTTRFQEYLDEREAVLRLSSLPAKKSRADQSNCPLVGAICCEHLNQQPFQSLVGKISAMQQFVSLAEQFKLILETEELRRAQTELEQLAKERRRLEQERLERERQEREIYRIQTFKREKAKLQNDFLINLRQLLPHLQPESREIYAALHTAQRELFSKLSINTDKANLKRALKHFTKTCKKHIETAGSHMDYGWLYRMTEVLVKGILALFVGTGMVLGGIAGQGILNTEHRQKYHDTFFTLNRSKGCIALEAFNQKLTSLKAEVKDLHSEVEESPILAL